MKSINTFELLWGVDHTQTHTKRSDHKLDHNSSILRLCVFMDEQMEVVELVVTHTHTIVYSLSKEKKIYLHPIV